MRVLFLDTVHPILEERLSKMGFTCEFDTHSSYEEISNKISSYTGVVIRSRIPMDAKIIAAAKKLKFIARSGAGLENIDLAAAETAGITVLNSPEGNMDAVGEHAIGMLLMLFNKLREGDREVREGLWNREENRGIELSNMTVGIIGYGNMGSALAKKLSGFGCEIIAFDKYKSGFASSSVREVSLEELKSASDVISIHLPLSAETHHYVDEAFINSCGKPFFLVNTARGKHVSISALLKGMEEKKVLGACLDVLEYESKSFEKLSSDELPKEFRELAKPPRVVLSPHVAGWTAESYVKLSSFLADKIENLKLSPHPKN